MDLYNLSTNNKIILGISTVTILILIYTYIKNLFYPNKTTKNINVPNNDLLIEGNTEGFNKEISILSKKMNENNIHLGNLINQLTFFKSDFNELNSKISYHLNESMFPTRYNKTTIHLSSKKLNDYHLNIIEHKYILNNKIGLRKFKNVIIIKLLEASIPYVPYNIWNINNYNKLKFNGIIISIDEGYYYIKELINEINSKLTNISFKYHNNTKNITIYNNSSNTLTIEPDHYPLFKRLGFHEEKDINNSGSKTGQVVDLSIPYIDIIYKKITPSNANLTDEHDNLLKRIYFNGKYGDIIYYLIPHTDYLSQDVHNIGNETTLSEIKLNFVRPDGSNYDFKGLHYDLKLEITELIVPNINDKISEQTNNLIESVLTII